MLNIVTSMAKIFMDPSYMPANFDPNDDLPLAELQKRPKVLQIVDDLSNIPSDKEDEDEEGGASSHQGSSLTWWRES